MSSAATRSNAAAYDTILSGVGYSRRKLLDRMIDAPANAIRATLVSRNTDDLADTPGLDVAAW